VIPASPRRVWADVRNLASHVEWMEEAVALRFTSDQTTGVGTTMECITRVGPLRTKDLMAVTEWDEGRRIGIRHNGAVTGTGEFRLRRRPRGGTRFTWKERLRFPWWMGGPLGGLIGARVLKRVWKRNLDNLAARF